MTNNLAEDFARLEAEASFDSTVHAVLISNAWDRANAAARSHPIKGPAIRFLDSLSSAVSTIRTRLIRL